jgi:hypothetical protein
MFKVNVVIKQLSLYRAYPVAFIMPGMKMILAGFESPRLTLSVTEDITHIYIFQKNDGPYLDVLCDLQLVDGAPLNPDNLPDIKEKLEDLGWDFWNIADRSN